MVIQRNMTSLAITEIWAETNKVFKKYKVPVTNHSLSSLVQDNMLLHLLLTELNNLIGSTYTTCIEGG